MGCRRGDTQQVLSFGHPCCVCRSTSGSTDGTHSVASVGLTLGAVPVGAPVLVAIRHHRWSPLFVPLLWGASGVDATTPVLDIRAHSVPRE